MGCRRFIAFSARDRRSYDQTFRTNESRHDGLYWFKPSFNQTYIVEDSDPGWWVSPYHFGIDQGPVILMIENYRTGLLWNIMRRCQPIVTGLRKAGFAGGWLH